MVGVCRIGNNNSIPYKVGIGNEAGTIDHNMMAPVTYSCPIGIKQQVAGSIANTATGIRGSHGAAIQVKGNRLIN